MNGASDRVEEVQGRNLRTKKVKPNGGPMKEGKGEWFLVVPS